MANKKHLKLLEKSVIEWNQWRKENPTIQIDLSKAKLSGMNLIDINLNEVNFDSAYLTRADFSDANLNYVYLGHAILKQTIFHHANLRYALLKRADLFQAELHSADLRYANLSCTQLTCASLEKATLVCADLRRATLFYASLEGANLIRADLSYANLTHASLKGANLTGACIEDWHINSETNFEDVVCDYIYLKWDVEKNCPGDRRPSDPNRNFAPGEFVKLIRKVSETVDLIFSTGIDWQAFFSSYQDLQCESEYGELDIRAIEKSPDDSLIIRVEVPEETDKAKLESQFHKRYETELKQLEGYYQQKLQAKDIEIQSYRRESTNMTQIAKLLAGRTINVEASTVGGDRITQSGNFGIGVNKGTVEKGANVSGVHYAAPQQSLQAAAKEIQALLEQLSKKFGDDEDILAAKVVKTAKDADSDLYQCLTALPPGSMQQVTPLVNHPAKENVMEMLDLQHQKRHTK